MQREADGGLTCGSGDTKRPEIWGVFSLGYEEGFLFVLFFLRGWNGLVPEPEGSCQEENAGTPELFISLLAASLFSGLPFLHWRTCRGRRGECWCERVEAGCLPGGVCPAGCSSHAGILSFGRFLWLAVIFQDSRVKNTFLGEMTKVPPRG